MIVDHLQGCGLNKKIILQIAIKIRNITASLNGWVSTLLVFRAYFCISEFHTPISIITQGVAAMKNIMKEVQKVKGERQVVHSLNKRNALIPMVSVGHDQFLNSAILV